MIELSLKEIHSELLFMLEDVIEVCNANDIKYYLSGGTLLGAVRHKGFIPWDDDMDLMMHREDYYRFEEIYREIGKYEFWSRKDKEKWNTPWNRIENPKTILKTNNIETTHGLFIDIFPIDNVPNNLLLKKGVVVISKVLDILRNGAKRTGYKDDEEHKLIKTILINPLGRLLGSYRYCCLIDSFAYRIGKISGKHSNYCGVIVVCYHYKLREFVPTSIYDENLLLIFETLKVNAPIGYDTYLKSLYGDYMKLPPIENQVAGHYPVYWVEA